MGCPAETAGASPALSCGALAARRATIHGDKAPTARDTGKEACAPAAASPCAACAWPPMGTQTAHKPAGGFIDCPVDHLTLPWWLYQQGTMAFGTLRVWLGT